MYSEALKDELLYQANYVCHLSKEANWTYLREHAEPDNIKEKVYHAFALIDERLA